MNVKQDKVTAEFYIDSSLKNLVGAVDIPISRMNESAEMIGKTICKVIHVKELEAVFINSSGKQIDQIVIRR